MLGEVENSNPPLALISSASRRISRRAISWLATRILLFTPLDPLRGDSSNNLALGRELGLQGFLMVV